MLNTIRNNSTECTSQRDCSTASLVHGVVVQTPAGYTPRNAFALLPRPQRLGIKHGPTVEYLEAHGCGTAAAITAAAATDIRSVLRQAVLGVRK